MSCLKKTLVFLLVICFSAIPLFSCGVSSEGNSSSKSSVDESYLSSISASNGHFSDGKSSSVIDSSVSSESPSDATSETDSSSTSSASSAVVSSSSSSSVDSMPSTSESASSGTGSSQNPDSSSEEEDDGSGITTTNVRNCVNVLDYGVEPNLWGVDQYDKFQQAIDTGKSIYVPAGYYYVSQTLMLRNQNLYGDGMYQTFILSLSTYKYATVLSLGRTSSVEDLTVAFVSSIITGEEAWGERVAILTGDNFEEKNSSWALQRGSQINRVGIGDCGTAICSRDFDGTSIEAGSFSVSYTNMEIQNFSYRGIDFTSGTRTGNVFSNIYMNSKYEVDSLFHMEGEESETSITQLNLEHTKVKRAALSLEDCRALSISTIHIEGIELCREGASFVHFKNSSGIIDALSVYYTAIDADNCSLIDVGDAVYDIHTSWQQTPPAVLSKLKIVTLHVKGLHDPNKAVHGSDRTTIGLSDIVGFNFVKRTDGAKGDYKINIYNYVYYTFQNDVAIYQKFATSGNISVVFDD